VNLLTLICYLFSQPAAIWQIWRFFSYLPPNSRNCW